MSKSYTDYYLTCDEILKNVCGKKSLEPVNLRDHITEESVSDTELYSMCSALLADNYISWDKYAFEVTATIKGYQFNRDGGYEVLFKEYNERESRDRKLISGTIELNNSTKFHNKIQVGIAALTVAFILVSTLYQIRLYNLTEAQEKASKIESETMLGKIELLSTNVANLQKLEVTLKYPDSSIGLTDTGR